MSIGEAHPVAFPCPVLRLLRWTLLADSVPTRPRADVLSALRQDGADFGIRGFGFSLRRDDATTYRPRKARRKRGGSGMALRFRVKELRGLGELGARFWAGFWAARSTPPPLRGTPLGGGAGPGVAPRDTSSRGRDVSTKRPQGRTRRGRVPTPKDTLKRTTLGRDVSTKRPEVLRRRSPRW